MNNSKEIEVILLVADLSGYTALTEAHGNITAAKVVNRYIEIVNEVLHRNTRLLESVGDEVLIVGKDVKSIIKRL